jgi:hypothetical protein
MGAYAVRWFARSSTVSDHGSLQRSSVLAALAHLRQEGDGDILPIPFEFSRLSADASVVGQLLNSDPCNYRWSYPRSFSVIRYPFKVRKVSQFIPIDSLMLESLVFSMGGRIEAARRPLKEKTVFSNRFLGGISGGLYRESLWNSFAQRGMELASQQKFALKLDVLNFYETIPHSYLKACLQNLEISGSHVACMMNALSHASYMADIGIPVGPHFSHLLAELILVGLDNALAAENIEFCRFNDDIHVFASSLSDIGNANAIISQILKEKLGLAINRAKESLMEGSDYLNNATTRRQSRSAEERTLLMNSQENVLLYQSRPTEKSLKEGRRRFKSLDVGSILSPYLLTDDLSFDAIAQLLKVFRYQGVPLGLGFVVDNLPRLLPVITEAFAYMESVAYAQNQVTKQQLRMLFDFYSSSVVTNNCFLQILLLRVLGKIADTSSLTKFVDTIPYLTPDGRRELLTIAHGRNLLAAWVNRQGESAGWMQSWEASALSLSHVEQD